MSATVGRGIRSPSSTTRNASPHSRFARTDEMQRRTCVIRWTPCLAAIFSIGGLLHAQTGNESVRKLYVVNTAGNNVTVVDVVTNKVLGRIEVGPRPHGIASA